ncbi:PREDICTED: transmembrane channel-like protein 7 isoform X1 [Rhagoletis zephyria]|uniref:transmembrane channel-like protein 7 isoform X1 n=1 Tax=Rhagoletis zephyria TaxID=28612 RepID=UPI000811369F|nr:PREDICTED: transmembrane channel-like protein 7 isoform X1 [Rhagoletis zephyria]
MSDASKNKQKSRKTNGWEEAGCEFYQENYCAEWDGFAKNPIAITTLLPSKQNRLGTSKRNYTQRDRKHKICWQQLTSTGPRNYQQNEGQFSLLPDLSQIINDEEHIWEEMFQIKQLPLSMHQKKEFKSDLQSATKLRLQGFNQLKWKHRKAWQKIALEWSKFSATIKLWQSSLKQIEGHFGSGVAAYFIFLRWLFYLNCITFLLIVIFVITPNILTREKILDRCKLSPNVNYSSNCLTEIVDRNTYVDSKNRESFSILDLVQGTGILEVSLMFYGGYSNKRVGIALKESHNSTHTESDQVLYDLSSAYIFAVLGYFTTTLIFIVKASAREFKDRLINGRWQFYQYCNLAFGGWDFCIHNEKSSIIKHKAVFNEFKNSIHSKRIEVERNNRSNDYMLRLIMIRIIVNFAVVIILILSAYIIFLLFNMSLQQGYGKYTNVSYIEVNSIDFAEVKEPSLQLLELFYDFAPYVSIVCLNLILPVFFKYLCSFEKYSPMFVIKISLIRMIFLRLASLFILLSRFYYIVIPNSESNISNFTSYKCWETFVGQQFYKLVLTDFVSHLFVTFCFNLPRAILALYFDSNTFVKFVCEQEFELSKHALDIVYLQTICWIGSFYMPFLPALTIVITFLMFYVKKFQCLVNSKPTKILYGTSRSNSLFMFVLLISFIVSVIVLTYAFSEVTPSVACGPFRGLKTVWDAPLSTFMGMPAFFKDFVFFFGTPGFVIPCFFVLTLLLYYFYAVSDANKNMVEVLKNQLVLEGHDKKFLLTRLLLTHQETQE